MTTTSRPKAWHWTLLSIVVIAAATGAWYVFPRGWMSPVYAWVRGTDEDDAREASDGDMNDMNMPGLEPAKSSGLPGRAKVAVPVEVQRRIGVTIGTVKNGPLEMTVQAVAIIRPNEAHIARIQLRTEGWVEKLFVNFTGQVVRKGDPLLSIYSRDLLTTQQEYLIARRAEQSGGELANRQSLAESARKRLELLGVSQETVEKLEQTGVPHDNVTLRSPIDGTVLEKGVQEKEYVTPEKELFIIADLSTVWVQAEVYEYELPHVELGQPATVTTPALPKKVFVGKVVFIQPTVQETTRTVQVRVELSNEERLLKPGMFAHITIAHQMGDGLLVPTSAIIRTGESDLAYRVESADEFIPVEVKIDEMKFGDRFHVLEGLAAGDKVVTSANFLIDSESRLREGVGGMAGMPGMDMGGTNKGVTKGTGERKKDTMKGMDHSKMK